MRLLARPGASPQSGTMQTPRSLARPSNWSCRRTISRFPPRSHMCVLASIAALLTPTLSRYDAELTNASSDERNSASAGRSAASTLAAEARSDRASRLTRSAACRAEAGSMSARTTDAASPRTMRSKAAAVPCRPAPTIPYRYSDMRRSKGDHAGLGQTTNKGSKGGDQASRLAAPSGGAFGLPRPTGRGYRLAIPWIPSLFQERRCGESVKPRLA